MSAVARSRLERCRGLLGELRVDALLVSDATDVRYLSGFRGDDTTLLLGADFAYICTDARFWDQVREEVDEFALVEVSGELLAESVGALRSAGAQGRLGIQGAALSYASYRALRRRHGGGLRDV
jgi:Xaa-Pro aminopeptidase